MKTKLLTLALLSSLLLGVQTTHAQDSVYSNVVGMYKVPKPAGGLLLLGVSIGENTTLSQLIDIDQFTGDALTSGADKIIAFNSQTQTYITYALYDDTSYGGETVAWRLASNFYGGDVDPVLTAGSAVFIRSVSENDVDIIVAGDVPVSETSTIEIVEGLQMISLPFTTKIDINSDDAGFISSGAKGDALTSGADRIIVWDSEAQSYTTYVLFDDTEYGGSTVEWRLGSDFYNSPEEPIEIDVGSGFWYNSKNGFTWVSSNPYFENLQASNL